MKIKKLINNKYTIYQKKFSWLHSHDIGYNKVIGNRQVQMIAIGGSIGTGLFLGTGSRLQIAGPALTLIYLLCGFFCFFILRALGELILYRPSSGNFVSYTREFLGEKAAYIAGWMYFLNWTMTGIVDITAIALYMHYWDIFCKIPQWIFALLALIIVGTMNIVGVKWFAEMEFWLSLIKVLGIIIFLFIGVFYFSKNSLLHNNSIHGLSLIIKSGFLFPNGIFSCIVLIQGVIFAFSSIELIGTAAGECKNPKKILPKAINAIIWKIGVFYIGSILLLVLLLPWYEYHANQSPFVTFFNKLGFSSYIGSIMNIIVLSASISSLNSGLYSIGRILRSMSMGGSAPQFMSKMNKKNIPYAGILSTIMVYIIGVILNYYIPSKIFEMFLNIASLGIISSWIFIIICQIKFRKAIKNGNIKDIVYFKMPGYPFTSWLTLIFLFFVIIIMAFDYPNGTYTIFSIPLISIILIIGWHKMKEKYIVKY